MPSENRRRDERIATALPLSFENGKGVTEDVAATGIFFWTYSPIAFAVGDRIDFTIENDRSPTAIGSQCRGDVVRVLRRTTPTGVAVRNVEPVSWT